MKKRVLSLLMAFVMVVSLLPATTRAAESHAEPKNGNSQIAVQTADEADSSPKLSAAVAELVTLAESWGLNALDHDLSLPESTSNGCEVVWTSSRATGNPGLTNTGVIKRPGVTTRSGTTGTLTATVYYEADSTRTVFDYTLKPIAYDELEAPAKTALEGLLPDLSSVMGDLTLFEGAGLNAYPTSTSYTKGIVLPIVLGGTTTQVYITVASDHEDIIGAAVYSGSAYGKNGKIDLPVTRPAADTDVTLTFTIKASNDVSWTVEKTAVVKAAADAEALQAAKAAAETAFAAISDYDGTNLETIRAQVNAALAAETAALETGWKQAEIETWEKYSRIAAAEEILKNGAKTVSITVQGYNKGDLYPGGDGSKATYFIQAQPVIVGDDWTVYQVLDATAKLRGWTLGGSSSYVSAIAGLGEKMLGSSSGWMYQVNTNAYINTGMGNYKVKDGDNILIYYVKNWGSVPACTFDEIHEWKQGKDTINLLTGGDDAKALKNDWETIRASLAVNGEWCEDLPLAVRGKSGSRVVWTSSDPTVVASDGKVTRGETAKIVTLTVDLYLGDAHVTKTYEVKIGGTGGIAVTVQVIGKDADSSLDSWTGTVTNFDPTTLDSTITYNKYGSYIKPVHALLIRLNAEEDFKFNDNAGLKVYSGGYQNANIDYLFNVNNTGGRKWTLRITGKDGEVRVKDVTTNCIFGYNLADGDTVSFVYAANLTNLKKALDSADNVAADQYTEESYAALKAAKEAAQAEYGKGLFADQTAVDSLLDALNAAIDALVPNEDIMAKLPGLLDTLGNTKNWIGGNGDGWGVIALRMAGRDVSGEIQTEIVSRADTALRATTTGRPTLEALRRGAALTALGTDLAYYIPSGGTRTAMDQMSYSYLLTGQSSTSFLSYWLLLNESGSYPEFNGVTREKIEKRLLDEFYKENAKGWASGKNYSSFDINSTIWTIAALAPAYLDEANANHVDAVAKINATLPELKARLKASTAFTTRAEGAIALMRIGVDPEEDGLGLISGQRTHLLADGTGFSTDPYGTSLNLNTPTVILSLVMYQQYEETKAAVNFISWHSAYDLKDNKDALNKTISDAKALNAADYTAESWAALEKAVADGKAALANLNLAKEDVTAYAKVVSDAAAALQTVHNTDALRVLIEKAKAVDPDIAYTEESREVLEAAIQYAEELLGRDPLASQSELNAATEALQEALDGLVVDGEAEIADIIWTITDNWLKEKDSFTDDWRVVDMAILSRETELITDTAAERKYVSAAINRINPLSVTDYERVLLAVTALGIDGSKLDQYRTFYDAKGNVVKDLVVAIGAFPESDRSVNGATFALLAYDSGNYTVAEGPWSRENLVAYLVKAQLEEGGWNLQSSGTADPDVTAMAITALTPYLEKAGVKDAVDRAMVALSIQTSKTCTFMSYETVNSNSSAMVMLAQLSLGRNPKSDAQFNRWSQGKQYSVLDGLLSFKTSGNLFGYNNNRTANVLSTEQGLRALAAYKAYLYSGKAVQAYQFGAPKTPEKWEEEPVAVKLEITSLPVKQAYQVGEEFDPTGLAVKVTFSDDTVISPTVDKLHFIGFDSITSGTRSIRVSYGNAYATFSVTVEGKGSSGGDSDKKYVYLRVADPHGVTYLERTAYEMERGETAFSLLGRSGLDYRPSFNTQYEGVYVEAIAGLAEFDKGAQSGWMYRVNGRFPQYSASLYDLKAGDYVEWLYTRDLGKDLGALDYSGTGEVAAPVQPEGTVIEPNPTIDGTTASASVTDKQVKDAIAKDKSANTITVVPKVKSNTKTVKVTLSKVAAEKIASDSSAVLAIESPMGTVSIPNEVLSEITKSAAGDKLVITITKRDRADVADKITTEIVAVVEVTITSGGKAITHFGGKTLEIAIPVAGDKHKAGESYKVFIISADGSVDSTYGKCVKKESNLAVIVSAKHLSTFVVTAEMASKFTDVKAEDYFYNAVIWALGKGVTDGVGNDLFAPGQPCTRAQIVTFLWRAAGSPEPKGIAAGMTDVVSGSYYEKAVAWAIEIGITTGTGEDRFSPDATCTRAQAVTFLARARNAKASGAAEFSDVPTDSYFAEAVAWAAANGITTGVGGGKFAPADNCTRAQIITFLYRAYNK